MSVFETLSITLLTSTEEGTLSYIQSIDKEELNGLDSKGNSLLFLVLGMYVNSLLAITVIVLR